MKRGVSSGAMVLILTACGLDAAGVGAVNRDASSVVPIRGDSGAIHGPDARASDGKKSTGGDDTSTADARHPDAIADAHDANVAAEASPPPPCSIPPGACVNALPAGWSLVVYATSQAAPCPSGYASADVVSSPEPQAGACGCHCNVVTPPSCDVGSIGRMVSTSGACTETGQGVTVNGPGCTAFVSGAGGLAPNSQSSPLPLTDGTCSASPAPDLSAVTTQPGRVCAPQAACEEQLCEGTAPEGFSLCVSQPGGGGVCPAGWQSPVVVGAAVDLSCSACTCDINSQSTCTNAMLNFYKDGSCTTLDSTVPIDGTCEAEPEAGDKPLAVTYSATLTQVCTATGPETPTVALSGGQTICCQFE